METLDDHKAKTESFYNNDDEINKNDITLSVNDDHSMINDKVSQNYIYEDSLKSTKDKEMLYNDIISVSSKLSNALKWNQKHQTIVFVFLLQLLEFVKKEDQLVNVVPDINTINLSFSELISSCKKSFISADDMSFADVSIRLPVKPMNGHNETNNQIKSFIEQK